MRTILISLGLLFLGINTFSQQVAKSTTYNGSFVGFLEYKPTNYNDNKNKKYPLIIFLHGIGERGNGTSELSNLLQQAIPKNIKEGATMTFKVNGKTETFLVLSPQLPKWLGAWDNLYVDAMLEYAKKNLRVDNKRIFLTGISLGGGGVWNYASSSLKNAKQFAAIAPICGVCYYDMKSVEPTIGKAGIGVWAFTNLDDNIVDPWCTVGAVEMLEKGSNKKKVKKTINRWGGHDAWTKAYDMGQNVNSPNLYEWFLSETESDDDDDNDNDDDDDDDDDNSSENNFPKPLPINAAPVAKAGNDITITLPANSITLRNSGSFDGDGNIKGWNWSKISGPSSFSISSANNESTNVNNLEAGTYVFRLTVTDNANATATDDITVVVNRAPNAAPVAKAGNDITITLPANSVTLNNSGSFDGDGNIKAWNWSKISGPSQLSIVSANNASTSVNNLEAGTYVFRLTVTDNENASATDDITVVVNRAPNAAPVAKAGNDITITLPANSISLKNSGSFDGDGTIKGWNWSKVSGPSSFSMSSANNESTNVNNLEAGTYIFRLTVTDDDNASASDDVTVWVNKKPNAAPVAKAGNDITITLPNNTVTLSNSGSFDGDGNIKGWNWSKIAGPSQFSIASANNASTSVNNLQAGTYIFRLSVTDDDNATATDDITVTVNSAANAAPVAKAGNDITITLPNNSVTLNNSGSFDGDGNIKGWNWSKVSGPSQFTIASANNASTSVSNLQEGSYVFRLTVTDNDNATAIDDITVTVLSAPIVNNKPPVANAGKDESIPVGQATILYGENSYSEGSHIKSYKWTKTSGPAKFEMLTPDSKNTWIRNMEQGVYVFQVTVTDNNGNTDADYVAITVNGGSTLVPGNATAPVANAGKDESIPVGQATVLRGDDSYMNGGNIKSYWWNKVSGPSTFEILTPEAKNTWIRNMTAGVYVYRLTVKGNNGAEHSDDVVITVNAQRAPVALAGKDEIIPQGQATVLRGENSYATVGSLKDFKWTKIAGPGSYEMLTANAKSTWIRNMTPGNYIYRLTVTDYYGGSAYDDVMITVTTGSVSRAGNEANQQALAPLEINPATIAVTEKLNIYPNPVINSLNIRWSGEQRGNATIKIIDAGGRLVKTISVKKEQNDLNTSIEVSKLVPGLYLIQIQSQNGKPLNTQFLKR